VLGFDVMAHMPSASFMSAGGYHHHLGANTWESRGAAPAPAGTASLRSFTILVPSGAERDRVLERLDGVLQDPSGNRFELAIG
jgi:catechol 2,3-dioxygenase